MALPWLIGAGIVAGIAAISALSDDDDDKSKNNGNNDDDDDDERESEHEREEQERRANAARERRRREREERKENLVAEFNKTGKQHADSFKGVLQGLFEVNYGSSNPFQARIYDDDYDSVTASARSSIAQLTCLDKKTQDNLAKFESLYDVKLMPTPDLLYKQDTLNEVNKKLALLKKQQQALVKMSMQETI